jgi:hypothetical protein
MKGSMGISTARDRQLARKLKAAREAQWLVPCWLYIEANKSPPS